MANYKRRKSRRSVRCTICTDSRVGNSFMRMSKRFRVASSMKTKSNRKLDIQRELEN